MERTLLGKITRQKAGINQNELCYRFCPDYDRSKIDNRQLELEPFLNREDVHSFHMKKKNRDNTVQDSVYPTA